MGSKKSFQDYLDRIKDQKVKNPMTEYDEIQDQYEEDEEEFNDEDDK